MINMLLKSIVQKDNLYIQNDASIRNLMELMNINQKGVVAILENNKPVGILTEKDIVEILYRGFNLDEKLIQFTNKTLIATRENRTIGYALNLMIEHDIRRVIIKDELNNFAGIVTQQDVLKHIEDDYYRSTLKVTQILERLKSLVSISAEKSLHDVLRIMVENKISAIPAISNGIATGIITERDILKLATQNIPLTDNVLKYMTSPVVSVNFETKLTEIIKIMNDNNIRRVVINNNEGFAVSLLTMRDIISNVGDYSRFLERKFKNAKDILNLLPEIFIEITDTGKEQLIIWANEKAFSKFGRDIIDKAITDLIPKETWDMVYYVMAGSLKIENVRFQKDNESFELSGYFIKTDDKIEIGRHQLIIRDISEDVRLSSTDDLTGIYNKRFITGFLLKEIDRSYRLKKRFTILLCDLDNFKNIKDKHGHTAGNETLKSFSKLLADNLRKMDVLGRYGEDEFMIIMPETSYEMATRLIYRLRLLTDTTQFRIIPADTIKLSFSFGIATYPDNGESFNDLLSEINSSLNKAKNNRNDK